jgi:hypothetical protein
MINKAGVRLLLLVYLVVSGYLQVWQTFHPSLTELLERNFQRHCHWDMQQDCPLH